jgi:methylthioribulose-1-phosphate dehydratase
MTKPVTAKEHWERHELVGFAELASQLADIGRGFYARGWTVGTSGNFSAVVTREPMRLAITSTGLDKSLLSAEQIVQIDADCRTLEGSRRPSDEARLHLAIVRLKGAGSVLHTHSVWGTLLSETAADKGGVTLEGYEMLKGLEGIHTHEEQEWLPILENCQDMAKLSRSVEESLQKHPRSHGLLIRRHGLYTWGLDLVAAKRHVEILEFLLEVEARVRFVKRYDSMPPLP